MLCHSMSFVKKKKKFSGKIGFKTWKDIEILGIDFFFEETFLTIKKKKLLYICNLFYTNTFYTNANSHYNQNLDKFSSVKYYSNIFTNHCVRVLLYCWILGYRRQINLFFSIFIVSYPMLQDKYTRICCNQYEGQPRMIDAN